MIKERHKRKDKCECGDGGADGGSEEGKEERGKEERGKKRDGKWHDRMSCHFPYI